MSTFPSTSFMNLFKNIIYNKSIMSNYSLDIWDAYIIGSIYKNELKYFEFHILKSGETWVSLAKLYYNDERLWWVTPLFNDIEDPFIALNPSAMLTDVTSVQVLKQEYLNQILLEARQNKILNDRKAKNGEDN